MVFNKNKKFYPVRNSPPQRPFGRASVGAISNGIYLAGAVIILTGLFFGMSALPTFAGECEKTQNNFSFSKFLNPLASLAEKVVKDFGYDVALAAAPDPDFCGSDSVGCSAGVPTATISWEAAPATVVGVWPLYYYSLTVPGVSDSPFNTGTSNTRPISSGLNNNTTYNWSVEAYYNASPYGIFEINYWGTVSHPYGFFTTVPCCLPPNAGNQYYRINPSTTITVSEHNICRKVTNSSSNYYFIPTKTQGEWQSFLNYPPAGISSANCCP